MLIAAGCQNKNTFVIKGTIKKHKTEQIYLNRVNVDHLVFIDSAKIGKNGNFKFRTEAGAPEFYQLGFTESNFVTLLAKPGDKLEVNFNSENLFPEYTVGGSEESEQVRFLDVRLAGTKRKLDSLKTEYDAASKEFGFEEKKTSIETQFDDIVKDIRKKTIEFIITNYRSMAAIKALYQRINDQTYVLYDPRDLQYLKIVSDSLSRYYPNSKSVRALAEDVKKEMNVLYSNQISSLANSIPETRLDPNLLDISGKRISLSSLKGKVVLLTFWSVKSKDCITENLQLKEVYKTYHNKGFEIYQINVDEDEELWKKEVRFDELPWISTREEDPLNPENAKLYNIKSLPSNYLYDRGGNIIGSNLHGKSLKIMLNQQFK